MKKFFALLLALVVPTLVQAEYKKPAEVRDILNQGYGATTQLGTQLVDKKTQVLKAQYSYAASGGAVGEVSLLDTDGKPAKLPDNAVIKNCLIDVVTAPSSTSSAATIALGTGLSATDLKAATAIASYSGLVACVPVGSAATSIKMTDEHTVKATIAAHPLTAGIINVFIEYFVSE